jgi:hypothetical protein
MVELKGLPFKLPDLTLPVAICYLPDQRLVMKIYRTLNLLHGIIHIVLLRICGIAASPPAGPAVLFYPNITTRMM